ncbi:hypothetical protein KQ939_03395 [Planococcus sp. CP5-4]|uniref:hypothetical protein n=1 Tax=unclassified Planococcus (in: firmicutes) TaxID=2662419 RepID=UPI001C22C6FB|nr:MULTISPECIES: hypothetical protein [unclassified Planococcus (in: firmicutes)]MBU9672025.1 hypothetical protein [Planococcus sp. CP5-4_YE]MBV0907588.1 hypothetical protein [Planococcus sp. CP5-4_UN]MBW6062755.1 hypothetical protein [Planococcus sp. CP5-4]
MRFMNVIIVFLIAFSFAGIVLYAVGPNLSSEAVAQKAFEELEQSGKMEEMVQQIEADPQVSRYMEEWQSQQEIPEEEQDNGMEEPLEEETTNEDNSIEVDSTLVPEDQELAFETKEDAASVMIEKVGFRNLLKMKNAVENDTMTAEQVMNELDNDLNEEEMLALKVMIFKEWQNRN